MLERIKYRRQLRRLRKEKKRTKKEYNVYIKKETDEGAKESMYHAMHSKMEEKDARIRELQSAHFCREADNLGILKPGYDDKGAWDGFKGSSPDLPVKGVVLTLKGIDDLRKRIRAERSERREVYRDWAAIIIGILGALIGVLAFLRDILL